MSSTELSAFKFVAGLREHQYFLVNSSINALQHTSGDLLNIVHLIN